MSETVERTRTFALLGHGGSGKTSIAEAMLFDAGQTKRLGSVDNGSSILDFDPEEVSRKITISAAFHDLTWKKHDLHLVDTPGDDNFLNDTRNCLLGVDGVIMLASAVSGVKVQGEKVWSFAKDFNLPCLAVVNKLDRERADFNRAVEEIASTLSVRAVPAALPIGQEDSFKGVVDLLSQKAFLFANDASGKMTEESVPEEMAEAVAQAREKLIEHIAEADDSLLERYLEGEDLGHDDLAQGLRAAVLGGVFLPVLPLSGTKNIGVQPVLDLIVTALPSPLDRGSLKAQSSDGDETEVVPDETAPLVCQVIKTVADPFSGRLSIIRIFSGKMTADSSVYNAAKGAKERFGSLFAPQGKTQTNIEAAGPGAIVAVAKLKETTTGDTLTPDKPGLILPALEPLPAVVSYAVVPKEKGDEEKVFSGLSKLIEEDVTLKLTREAQTKDMILWAMGQVHVDVTLERLKRKFGAEVVLKPPRVPYLETIKKKAMKIQGRYKKQTGGRGQFGDAYIDIEPTAQGEGFVFEDKIAGGVIPRQFIPAVEKGIVERAATGILAGYPMVDFKVRLVFGSYHSVDSSEMAFKIAGSLAFQKAAAAANPILLEPIMTIEVVVSEDSMGDVIGDLNSRRGRVLGMGGKSGNQVIKALVPMAEILQYAPDLTSMTGGRGSFTLQLDHYAEVPSHVQEKIIAEAKGQTEAEG